MSWLNKQFARILTALLFVMVSYTYVLSESNSSVIGTVLFNRPPLSNRGAPGDRQGAGTRHPRCPPLQEKIPLTALVPNTKESDKLNHVWGLTLQESPTFWFYVPYLSEDKTLGEFILWDETEENRNQHQAIYAATFNVTPGIISLTPTVKLQKNRRYHWYLYIPSLCQEVNGWVERTEVIALQSRLKESLPDREKAILYAQAGIWQDALTILAQLHSQQPENPTSTKDWIKLLEDVDLGDIAQTKIVPCCTLNPNYK